MDTRSRSRSGASSTLRTISWTWVCSMREAYSQNRPCPRRWTDGPPRRTLGRANGGDEPPRDGREASRQGQGSLWENVPAWNAASARAGDDARGAGLEGGGPGRRVATDRGPGDHGAEPSPGRRDGRAGAGGQGRAERRSQSGRRPALGGPAHPGAARDRLRGAPGRRARTAGGRQPGAAGGAGHARRGRGRGLGALRLERSVPPRLPVDQHPGGGERGPALPGLRHRPRFPPGPAGADRAGRGPPDRRRRPDLASAGGPRRAGSGALSGERAAVRAGGRRGAGQPGSGGTGGLLAGGGGGNLSPARASLGDGGGRPAGTAGAGPAPGRRRCPRLCGRAALLGLRHPGYAKPLVSAPERSRGGARRAPRRRAPAAGGDPGPGRGLALQPLADRGRGGAARGPGPGGRGLARPRRQPPAPTATAPGRRRPPGLPHRELRPGGGGGGGPVAVPARGRDAAVAAAGVLGGGGPGPPRRALSRLDRGGPHRRPGRRAGPSRGAAGRRGGRGRPAQRRPTGGGWRLGANAGDHAGVAAGRGRGDGGRLRRRGPAATLGRLAGPRADGGPDHAGRLPGVLRGGARAAAAAAGLRAVEGSRGRRAGGRRRPPPHPAGRGRGGAGRDGTVDRGPPGRGTSGAGAGRGGAPARAGAPRGRVAGRLRRLAPKGRGLGPVRDAGGAGAAGQVDPGRAHRPAADLPPRRGRAGPRGARLPRPRVVARPGAVGDRGAGRPPAAAGAHPARAGAGPGAGLRPAGSGGDLVIGVLLQATPSPSPTPAPLGANVIGFSFLLSLMVWGPAVVAVITAVTPEPVGARRLPWGLAFWTTLGVLVLAIAGYSQFQSFTTGLPFEERMPWMPRLGVSYHLGVDGISMALLVLNGLVFLCAALASWEIRERGRQYFSLLLFAEAAANGVLAAQDAFLLLLFWAAGILPVALLVAGWAGARGPAAAARLAAFWGAGTATLLVAVLLLYDAAGASSFDLGTLAKPAASVTVQVLVGIALTVTAATRLPLVPAHGWIRDAAAEAPAGVAILIAGAVSRLGGYLLVRAQARELGVAAGLAGRAPKLDWLLLTGCLAVLGMPFLATFPGAVMVFLGSFRTQVWAASLVAAGVVLGGMAVARLMHRVAFGAPNPDAPPPGDSSLAESWCLGVLVGALLWVGLVPSGPKLFGNPIFLDQGLVNIVNSPTADLAAPYAPPTPPSPKPSPSPSPSASPAAPSPSPSP